MSLLLRLLLTNAALHSLPIKAWRLIKGCVFNCAAVFWHHLICIIFRQRHQTRMYPPPFSQVRTFSLIDMYCTSAQCGERKAAPWKPCQLFMSSKQPHMSNFSSHAAHFTHSWRMFAFFFSFFFLNAARRSPTLHCVSEQLLSRSVETTLCQTASSCAICSLPSHHFFL